ncbi:MAG TPA: sensor histidine kinase [Myxococcales bacterium]
METSGKLSEAHRRLARSLLRGMVAVGVLSVVGPLLSYRIDVAETERQLRSRGAHEARLYADSLSFRILTMESELRRIARMPEVDFSDNTFEPEKILLRHAHEQSALFTGGVALLDLAGRVASGVPADFFARPGTYSSRRWFQRALASRAAVVDRFGEGLDGWVVVVPIGAGRGIAGFVIGVARADDQPLGANLDPAQQVAVVDHGDVLFEAPRSGAFPRVALSRSDEARSPDGLDIGEGKERDLVFAASVRGPMEVWLANRFDAAVAPIRRRLIEQLLLLVTVQLVTWIAFAVFIRSTWLEFRKMEARATDQEKMASLGVAASLIAHEVKNTLNGITAATSSGVDQRLSGRVVRSQLARLSNLARSLLAFGRPARPQLAPVLLDGIVREAIEALHLLPESADVAFQLSLGGPVLVDADPSLAATAVDNVLRNAIEAAVTAKDVGRISEPTVRVTMQGEEMAMLVVEDNGGGPPAGFEEHAFEPFVTSKPKGVGLGLATTRHAMEALGGSVSFERIEGGSRFVLAFRLHQMGLRDEPEHAAGG